VIFGNKKRPRQIALVFFCLRKGLSLSVIKSRLRFLYCGFALPGQRLVGGFYSENISLLALERNEVPFNNPTLSIRRKVFGLMKVNKFDAKCCVCSQLPIAGNKYAT
jgi:hypothetical protein